MKAKRKAILCDPAKPEERKLWEYLQSLPHGKFSSETKQFWLDKMKESDKK